MDRLGGASRRLWGAQGRVRSGVFDLICCLKGLAERLYRGEADEALRAQAALRCWGADGMPTEAPAKPGMRHITSDSC